MATADAAEAVRGAELVVLATPVGAMGEVAERMLPGLAPLALVTDVGSVKGPVLAALAPVLEGAARFVGSHPMAGGEQAGMEHASGELFQGAACIVTPGENGSGGAVREVSAFWGALGCRVYEMSAAEHDRAVALVSHVPHLVAAALAHAAAEGGGRVLDLAGPGFRDCTRVALGPPAMWAEILRENREAVLAGLEGVRRALADAAGALEGNEDLSTWLDSAKAARSLVQVRRPT